MKASAKYANAMAVFLFIAMTIAHTVAFSFSWQFGWSTIAFDCALAGYACWLTAKDEQAKEKEQGK